MILLRKEVIGDKWDAHKAKFFNKDAAADRQAKRLLTLSIFMAPIATFERIETDTAMDEKN